MTLIKEDWERAHLLDEIYLKEIEFQEQELLAQQRLPAIISVKSTLKKLLEKKDCEKEKD